MHRTDPSQMPHRSANPYVHELEDTLLNLVVAIRKQPSGHYRIEKKNKHRVDAAIHLSQRILASRNSGTMAS